MNSNQFFTLLQKGNDLQKEDFQQLVKLHESFPYFQIPAVLAAKYESQHSKDGSTELLHKAAILSPDRAWLRYLIEENILFLEKEERDSSIEESQPSVVIIDRQEKAESAESINQEEISDATIEDPNNGDKAEEQVGSTYIVEKEQISSPPENQSESISNTGQDKFPSASPLSDERHTMDTDKQELDPAESTNIKEYPEENKNPTSSDTDSSDIYSSEKDQSQNAKSDLITSSHPPEDTTRPLITSSSSGDEDTRPDLILPDSHSGKNVKDDITKEEANPELTKADQGEEDKPIIEPIQGPPSSRQQILKQLEDNLAKLKSESNKNKPVEESKENEDDEDDKPARPRRKRSGEDLIDSIKKKEKREIKDSKKKEQNDIIKAFNKKSIKMAAIKENEDVNKLQDLSLPSTKINDRMVSESYAKLLTQQGKKAAAIEIYKKLILKFPQKKAYFADLIQQLEE